MNRSKMKRRDWIALSGTGLFLRPGAAQTRGAETSPSGDLDKVPPDQLLLKDYRPKSIYKIPVSEIKKAKYPAIDCHHHAQSRTQEQVDEEVRIMDAAGLDASVAFPAVGQGPIYRPEAFEQVLKLYSKYPKRFYIYCGLDLSAVDQPGFGPATIKELERCHKLGAVGIGEIHDKGMGIGGVMGGPANWQGDPPGPRVRYERAGPRRVPPRCATNGRHMGEVRGPGHARAYCTSPIRTGRICRRTDSTTV